MASSFEAFKNLDLTRDEVERIANALKQEEFRKLLVEYVDELQDPENKKLYEQEITQLEKERGVDVTFINPTAGYVIKTSVNGNKKGFINVCSNENIQKPTSSPATQEGTRGLQWNLPHSLAPPRDDVDNKGVRCQVFDVIFHPDTLHLAQKNKAFRNMVNNSACEAVEGNFDVKLDQKNLKFPKLNYKGMARPTVIRKASAEKPPEMDPDEKAFIDKMLAESGRVDLSEVRSPKKTKKPSKRDVNDSLSCYTTPKYIIKHRSHIDLEEFTEHKNAKINSATPKELVIEINLPLLKSSADIVLDVAEKQLHLTSETPAKYKLSINLPYQVNQDCGNAKFDKDKKKLIITLPVRRHNGLVLSDVNREDSGVESDRGSQSSSPPEGCLHVPLVSEINSVEESDERTSGAKKQVLKVEFLDPDLHYSLPEYNCHTYENFVAFTLNVKNVAESSVKKIFKDRILLLKFTSVSSSFYPLHYAVVIKLPLHTIDVENVSIETWDNNVVVQIPFQPSDRTITSYFIGLNEDDLMEQFIEEPSVINNLLENGIENPKKQTTSINNEDLDNNQEASETGNETEDEYIIKDYTRKIKRSKSKKEESETNKSNAIDILGAFSESSGDELSCNSYSPSKNKGILKRLSRSSASRSMSESSIEDYGWPSSFENCQTSHDSVIPEEGEMSTSLKKTVRFNDVVSRQLYRSNSSILGQRKKNQRKAKAKKRVLDRRHSESEVSESEEKKEGDLKTFLKDHVMDGAEANENDENDEKRNDFTNDVFHLDMYL